MCLTFCFSQGCSSVNGVETWQVYGLGGELLAEYPANGTATSPQKEYGYRNGQLLISADAPTSNSATFINTDTTTQGSWKGVYGADGYNIINDTTSYPSYASVAVSGQASYTWASSTSDVRALQKSASSTDRIAACWYSATNFTIDINLTDNNTHQVAVYALDWDGANTRSSRMEVLDAVTNDVLDSRDVTSYSNGKYFVWQLKGHLKLRISHVSPAGANAAISGLFFDSRRNVALAANGATASASSTYAGYGFTPAAVIDGDRKGTNWLSGGGWNDAAPANTFPDWLEIDFSGTKTINEVDVFTNQDNYASPAEPTESMVFSIYGLTGYEVQYWTGSAWQTIPGASITGNNKVWRKIIFSKIATSKIRVLTNASADGYSRLTEVEAWESPSGSHVQWLVTDQLGTPRMVLDQSGSLANMKRHDYLPFGEELFAPTSGRSTAQGYASGDGVRQQFTQKERDVETGLDYFQARYYASLQGRFIGADPYDINLERQYISDPSDGDVLLREYIIESQRWNRYTYALNNPLKYIDPDGRKDEVYTIKILGEDVKVTISDKITDQKARADIKQKIQDAADKINNGYKENKLTNEEVKQIRSLNGIKVVDTTPENLTKTGLQGNTYMLTAYRIQNSSAEFVGAEIVHESYHTLQWNYNCGNAERFERRASAFTVGVISKLDFGPKVIEAFQQDALRGHTPCVKPKRRK